MAIAGAILMEDSPRRTGPAATRQEVTCSGFLPPPRRSSPRLHLRGLSPFPRMNQAVAIAGVMDALDVQKAALVTHDIGNMVGWHFNFRGPDEERLVRGRERIYLDRFWNELSANPQATVKLVTEFLAK
jgi:pimeloyl-ACP methyl ester carboxylesterase